MRSLVLIALASAAVLAPGVVAAQTTPQAAYDVVPVAADERSGPSREIVCSVGDLTERPCTFTPLFGDGSFQLDGESIAVRLLIFGEEANLFEVFGPERRVPVLGIYRRDTDDRACWVSDGAGPSRVCAR